jgi:hypothetical protein
LAIDWIGRLFTAKDVVSLVGQHLEWLKPLLTVLGIVIIIWNERRLNRLSYISAARAADLSHAAGNAAQQAAAAETQRQSRALEAVALVQFLSDINPRMDVAVRKYQDAWTNLDRHVREQLATEESQAHWHGLGHSLKIALQELKLLSSNAFGWYTWPEVRLPEERLVPPEFKEIKSDTGRDQYRRLWVAHQRDSANIAKMQSDLAVERKLSDARQAVAEAAKPIMAKAAGT